MTSSSDRERLAAIRSRHADASRNWQLGAGGTEIFAVVVKGTAPVAVVELTNDCGYVDRDFLLHAHDDTGFLLGLVQRAAEKIRRIEKHEERQLEQAQRTGDFAAECGMRCGEQAFRQFLLERKGASDVSDATRVASHVRYLLKVESRSEINNSAEARNRWFDLRSEFEAWMKVSA